MHFLHFIDFMSTKLTLKIHFSKFSNENMHRGLQHGEDLDEYFHWEILRNEFLK